MPPGAPTALLEPPPAAQHPPGLATATPAPATADAQALRPATAAAVLARAVAGLGVRHAFGVGGGGIAPLWSELLRTPVRVTHACHETGAAFMAVEAYFATGVPAAVLTTTGPGLTNALTGVAAARCDGAKLLLLSAATSSARRGRGAFQETGVHTLPAGLAGPGPLFHLAAPVEAADELPALLRRVAQGFARPGPFVAHLALPLTMLTGPSPPVRLERAEAWAPAPAPAAVRAAWERLAPGFAIWVGHGARGAAPQVRALAERTGAPVVCSPRGKGILPEDHPLFAGVTGFAGHGHAAEAVAAARPQAMLVLGTRLGEFTSFWDPAWVPPGGLVHVDLDPAVPGAAYPEAPTLGIEADVGAFLDALLQALPGGPGPRPQPGARPPLPRPGALEPRQEGPVRPAFLMQEIQREVVDGSDAVVLTEAGTSFAWGTHLLRFDQPGRYRVSTGWGSMGHAVAGAVGAALAADRPAVAIAGDGAMLMTSEVATAVRAGARVVWVVLNDARYGMVEQGMRLQGLLPPGDPAMALPPVDFAALAKAMGAVGLRAATEAEVGQALRAALRAAGPAVIDVRIDPAPQPPFGQRIRSLVDQGAVTL